MAVVSMMFSELFRQWMDIFTLKIDMKELSKEKSQLRDALISILLAGVLVGVINIIRAMIAGSMGISTTKILFGSAAPDIGLEIAAIGIVAMPVALAFLWIIVSGAMYAAAFVLGGRHMFTGYARNIGIIFAPFSIAFSLTSYILLAGAGILFLYQIVLVVLFAWLLTIFTITTREYFRFNTFKAALTTVLFLIIMFFITPVLAA
ncbi:MAG: YIP1 family protein [Candidatus Diapherotrites archaeon]|nr:YIP1 family protein [Candidatus Diapherotrites archaeon]